MVTSSKIKSGLFLMIFINAFTGSSIINTENILSSKNSLMAPQHRGTVIDAGNGVMIFLLGLRGEE